MPIHQPSQYNCDKMEKGDIVIVKSVGPIYKYIRKHFLKNKNKIRVRKDWEEPTTYIEYYQEDCTLLFAFEHDCIQTKNDVRYIYSSKFPFNISTVKTMKSLQVGLYNIQFNISDNESITIPMTDITSAIDKNREILKTHEDYRKIQEAIKYQRFKGDYFRKYVQDNNIDTWTASYCPVCGEKIIFGFMHDKDEIFVENACICNTTKFNLEKMTYDEFSLWYTNQVASPTALDYFNKFWFKEGSKEVEQ